MSPFLVYLQNHQHVSKRRQGAGRKSAAFQRTILACQRDIKAADAPKTVVFHRGTESLAREKLPRLSLLPKAGVKVSKTCVSVLQPRFNMTATSYCVAALTIVVNLQGLLGQTGQFWHVTDFHWDTNYTQNGDPTFMCWSNENNYRRDNPGPYGNYACDSPWTLVQSTLNFMQSQRGDVDFVVWTGDDSAHVAEENFSLDKVVEIIGNITETIRTHFPQTPVIPVFGNHDAFPKHNLPAKPSELYIRVGELWCNWLREGCAQFKKSGYYSMSHPTLANVTVLGLNTPLYYQKNSLVTSNDSDPAGQFAWMDGVLTDAAQNNRKAYIVAHVPPGLFGRKVVPEGYQWFRPKFNKKYLDLIIKHSATIIGQFYGHDHTDSFKLYYDSQGVPVNAHYAAPAVTPWNTTLSGIGPNNPGVRLFTYNPACGSIQNYEQYYLDLPAANSQNQDNWKLEYSFLQDYNLPDMTYASVDRLAQTFATTNRTLFDKYFTYNSVSATGPEECDSVCQRNHYCSITEVDYNKFAVCNADSSAFRDRENFNRYRFYFRRPALEFRNLFRSRLVRGLE